jgi:S1-C subfamily serine protease
MTRAIVLAAMFVIGGLFQTSYAENSVSAVKKIPLDQVIENTLPAVISLQVETDVYQEHPQRQGPGMMVPRRSAGTGFFISSNGIAVTNAHVVRDAKTILITMQDGNETIAHIVGIDMATDIAVLKVPVEKVSYIPLVTNRDARVGDSVLAIGNSFGLPQTVTAGIISAMHRTVTNNRVEDFIQTDTPINMGNSGGPLINKRGELVGVNNMIIGVAGGNNGVGFAIPTNIVKNVVEQIVVYGATQPGQLGVISQDVSPDLAKALKSPNRDGALISEVVAGTPAASAGLQAKDIIARINDVEIHSSNQLRSVIYTQRAGSKLKLTVYRAGVEKQFELATRSALDEVKQPSDSPQSHELFSGVALVSHESLATDGSLLKGVKVVDIRAGTRGWLAGLLPGDIITQINSAPITTIGELTKLKVSKMDKPLLLEIIRGMHTLYLVMPE